MMDRRMFLAAGGATLALGALRPAAVLAQSMEEIELTTPLTITSGTTLTNKWYRPSGSWNWNNSYFALLDARGANNVTLRNVWVTTSLAVPGSYQPGGTAYSLRGLAIDGTNIVVDGFYADRMPRAGIVINGGDTITIQNVKATRCWMPILAETTTPTTNLTMRRCALYNGWSGERDPAIYSRIYPSGYTSAHKMGWSAFNMQTVSNSLFEDISCWGESQGFKFVQSTNCTIRRIRTSGITMQGGTDNTISDCWIDRAISTTEAADWNNGLQVSYDPDTLLGETGLTVTNTVFDGALKPGGHAIQAVDDCEIDVRSCSFRGFRGIREGREASALDLFEATANADFASVNTFLGGQRVLSSRTTL